MAPNLLLRYGCAVISTLFMALVRLGLHPWLGSRAPYGLFILSVIFTSWVAGIGPGIVAFLSGLMIGLNFLTASRPNFAFHDASEWIGLINFILISLLIIILNEKQRHAKSLAEANILALNEKQAQLEQHQAELEALNVRLKRAMQETHHRVKNNLQVVSALAEMQTEPGQSHVSATAIERIGTHVQALAMIHDLLTQEAQKSLDADALHVKDILDKLIPLLRVTAGNRQIHCAAEDIILSARQGAALALLLNELVSNALKHGKGGIEISLRLETESARLEVCDEGPGFSADFDPRLSAHTGLDLIDSIGRWDLRGTVVFANREQGGARVWITFPLSQPADIQSVRA